MRAGSVVIRGGQFVMDNSSLKAVVSTNFFQPPVAGGTIEVTAEQVALSNHSTIDASVSGRPENGFNTPGHITFNVGTFSATDSAILALGDVFAESGGAVTIARTPGLR